jgi:hypothetical protein
MNTTGMYCENVKVIRNKTLPITEVPRLLLTKLYSFNWKIKNSLNFKVAITELYPQIPWELVVDPLESEEHIWDPVYWNLKFVFFRRIKKRQWRHQNCYVTYNLYLISVAIVKKIVKTVNDK